MDYRSFGWNGLCFRIPVNMRMISHGGNSKEGNVRIESEDRILEAKWLPIPKKPKPLDEIAGQVVEQLENEIKKKIGKKSKKQIIKVVAKGHSHVFKHDAIYMVLKHAGEERYYIWFCDESERFIILRFLFAKFDANERNIIRNMLRTIQCHSEDNLWALHYLQFKTPKDFLLEDSEIAVGRGYFKFSHKEPSTFSEKNTRIIVDYYSMANLVYKETYTDLDKWFEMNYYKDLVKRLKERKIRFRFNESKKVNKHKAILKNGITNSGISMRKTSLYSNATWYCSGSNRIYSITVSSSLARQPFLKRKIDSKEFENLFEETLAKLKCH